MTVTCVNDAPVADDETFNGTDSARSATRRWSSTTPTTARRRRADPKKTISGDILAGDTDIDGPGPLTVTAGTFATNDGGSVDDRGRRRLHVPPGRGHELHRHVATSSTTRSATGNTPDGRHRHRPRDDRDHRLRLVRQQQRRRQHAAPRPRRSTRSPRPRPPRAPTTRSSSSTATTPRPGYDAGGYAMNAGERLIGEHEGLRSTPTASALGADTLHPANAGAHPTLTATNADVIDLDDGNDGPRPQHRPAGHRRRHRRRHRRHRRRHDRRRQHHRQPARPAPSRASSSTPRPARSTSPTSPSTTNGATGVASLNNAGTVDLRAGRHDHDHDRGRQGPRRHRHGTWARARSTQITVTGSGTGGVRMTNTTGTTTFGDGPRR